MSLLDQASLFPNEEDEIKNQNVWARLIKTRDGRRCSNYKKIPNRNHDLFVLNAHHLLPKKFGGKNTPTNGITLCRACHAAEHPEYQQKFFGIFKLQVIQIRDFVLGLVGIAKEFQYYQLLRFLTDKVSFRPLQKQIVKTIVEDKKHVFVVMPTGTGKSLLYQIPGLLNQKNPSLVITPLKALQVDQVAHLNNRWIPATYINASLSKSEISERIKAIKQKLFPFVFIHPKQLLSFNSTTQEINIKYHKPLISVPFDYMVVDEVHVVKGQGLSFVKEYYYLNKIYDLYNRPQMILLTATASKRTRDFIIDRLGLRKEDVEEYVSGFKRPEISLEVYQTNKYDEQRQHYVSKDVSLIDLLKNKPVGKTIVFATTKKQVDTIYDFLKENGFIACKYHSGLNDKEKELNFKLFTEKVPGNSIDIMVATSAFGMGIDIPNIHQVIHYSLPFSLTDYYQQIGRAGRDGRPSVAQLLYDNREETSMIDFINSKTLENEKNDEIKDLLAKSFEEERKSLMGYITALDKWQYILDYFGEPSRKNVKRWLERIILIVLIFIFLIVLGYLLTYRHVKNY